MPAWIVPVLRLVSATRVEPTTGVVISATGLVLVADDFASSADEIIVLDGGTDIIRNGRPATIVHQFPAEGLMVISVESLNQTAARFTTEELADGSTVHLQAFPPAELIEQGASPLDISTTIYTSPENNQATLSDDTPLPNVSGPILDECGRLAGYSSANGVQSMSTSESPRYHRKGSLLAILSEMQIDIIEIPCEKLQSPVDETPVEKADESKPEPVIPESETADETDPTVKEPDDGPPADDEPDLEENSLSEPEVPPPAEEIVDPEDDVLNQETGTRDDEDGNAPIWIWLFAAVLLLGSTFVFYWIRRSRSLKLQAPSARPPSTTTQDDGDEVVYPVEEPDSLLLIEGTLSDGTNFKHSCKVSHKAINIVIGRGNADINIDSPAISRQHVSLNGTREILTITDLGSNNGTSINGIPCLEGEIMFVEPADIIILGNARFRYSIIPAKKA